MPIFTRIDPDVEYKFRQKVLQIYGAKKGAIENAIEDAIRIWLAIPEGEKHTDSLFALFTTPHANVLECMKEIQGPSNSASIATKCRINEKEATKYLYGLEGVKMVTRKDGNWALNPKKIDAAARFLKQARELEPLSYSAICGHPLKIPEDESTELMTNLAAWSTDEIVATSFHDVGNWGGDVKEAGSFWGGYIEAQKRFISTVSNRTKRENPSNPSQLVRKNFIARPPVRRIFIFDQEQFGTKRSRENIKRILKNHLGIEGYGVRCILKDTAERIRSRVHIETQASKIHDFVMFDRKLVVEVVRVPSKWGRNSKNTYGLAYVDPLFGDERKWTEIFGEYFEKLWSNSTHCKTWLEDVNHLQSIVGK